VRIMTRVLGVREKGTRVDIKTPKEFGNMQKIIEILDKNKMVLLSMMTIPPQEGENEWLIVLRLKGENADQIAEELKADDFNVTYVG